MNIWPDIRKNKSEASRDPDAQPGLMADTLEALIGAIFLDSDFESAKDVIHKWLMDYYYGPKI